MDRFLRRPRIYLLYFVGLATAAYVGAVVGILVVFPYRSLQGVTPGEYLTELAPIGCGWLWLPCLVAAVFLRLILLVLGGTIDRYSNALQPARPGWVLAGFCLATFVGSALYAGCVLTALSGG